MGPETIQQNQKQVAMSCGKKLMSKDQANRLLYAVRSRNENRMGDRKIKRMYYCHECSGWHMTGMTLNELYKSQKLKKK
jgi:hypothetical protein